MDKTRTHITPFLLIVVAYALFAAAYMGMRYSWRAFDGDEARLTRASQIIFEDGALSESQYAYSFGYVYPALNTFLAMMTDQEIETIQLYLQPILVALLVPIAYATFLGLVGQYRVAILAVLLLFLQAEFLFEATRSSHAKMTWMMGLLLLYVLTASFKAGNKSPTVVKWVVLFYLTAYAMIASSFFFSSNYIFALAFAFLGGRLLTLRQKEWLESASRLNRLIFITLSCSILVFLFISYLYPPAFEALRFLRPVQDRLAALFMDLEVANNPYAYVRATWINNGVYLVLTAFSWLVLGLSFLVWLRLSQRMIKGRDRLPANLLLLWLLYAGFATLMVIAVVLDLAGVFAANLQVRLFPNLMVFAIPLTSLGLTDFLSWLRNRSSYFPRLVGMVFAFAILFFSAASTIKTSSEPLLSNQWNFYKVEEGHVMDWIPAHIKSTNIWLGNNNRLQIFKILARAQWEEQGIYAFFSIPAPKNARYYLVTEVSTQQATRMGVPMPDLLGKMRIYDSGEAAIYKTRPKTPYQR